MYCRRWNENVTNVPYKSALKVSGQSMKRISSKCVSRTQMNITAKERSPHKVLMECTWNIYSEQSTYVDQTGLRPFQIYFQKWIVQTWSQKITDHSRVGRYHLKTTLLYMMEKNHPSVRGQPFAIFLDLLGNLQIFLTNYDLPNDSLSECNPLETVSRKDRVHVRNAVWDVLKIC